MNKQPLLILAVCMMLGILFQENFSLEKIYLLPIAVCCLLITACTFATSYFLQKARPYLLALMFFGIGMVLHAFRPELPGNIRTGKNESIVFRISGKLNSNEKNRKYEILALQGKQTFRAVLSVPKTEPMLDFRHDYAARVYLSKPFAPAYDFQFDYAGYLRRKNIGYLCYAKDQIGSSRRADLSLAEEMAQKRLDVLSRIDRTSMSSASREFLKGIILADRTEIDAQTVQDFNRSGLVHFLAISGTHIVVIFGLVYFLLVRLLPLSFRKAAVILSLVFIWLFTAFIGFGSSVVRSSVMLSVYFIYVLLQRKPDLLHSLALSAFLILVADTRQIFDVGFQLSFLAVLGIYWLNGPILSLMPPRSNGLKKIIFNTLSISAAAQLATLPLVLYYFHQFSFVSIAANFFIVPFSELVIVFSFLMTALVALGLDMGFINAIYDLLIRLLLQVIHWFAGSDVLFFDHIPMNLWESAAFFLAVFALRPVLVKPDLKRWARFAMSVCLFFMVKGVFTVLENHKTEVLVHRFSGSTAVSVKKNNSVCFWIDKKADRQKVIRYIVNPYCSSRRVDHILVKELPENKNQLVYQGKIYNLH